MSGAGDGLGYSNLRIDQTYMALSCFVYIDTGGYPEMEILIEKDAKPCKTIRFWGSDMAGVISQSQKHFCTTQFAIAMVPSIMHINVQMYEYITYIHFHIFTFLHFYMYTYIHIDIYTCIHNIYIIYTYIHIYIYTYIHT